MEAIEYTAIEEGVLINCRMFVEKNFLPEEHCNELIKYYNSAIDTTKATDIHTFFSDRLIWFTHVPDASPAKNIMRQTRINTIKLIKEFYQLEYPIYGDSIQLVSWPEGMGMPTHYDNRHPRRNEPHGTPWREYAGVIYLNDDYAGGELYISSANPNIVLKPEKGMLVVFGGGDGFMHGVQPPYGNTRYTMPCWFTRDITKNEVDYSAYL